MASYMKTLAITALLTSSATIAAAQSGSGTTTRYWDCCKPSCAWSDKPGIATPVKTCDISNNPLADANAQSGCAGGNSYMCSDQSPWAVSDELAYGFAAVGGASPSCCSCYQLTFTSSALAGKKMIVQATNTGSDVGQTQFDLAIPGGGLGIFDGCSKQWGATPAVWGKQYGGSDTNTCSQFPSKLQSGCGFRWDWMGGADNPNVDWEIVTCPAEIVAKSGCTTTGYQAPAKLAAAPIAAAPAAPAAEEPAAPVVAAPAEEEPAAPVVAAPVDNTSSGSTPADGTTDSAPVAAAPADDTTSDSTTTDDTTDAAPVVAAPVDNTSTGSTTADDGTTDSAPVAGVPADDEITDAASLAAAPIASSSSSSSSSTSSSPSSTSSAPSTSSSAASAGRPQWSHQKSQKGRHGQAPAAGAGQGQEQEDCDAY